MRNRLTVMYRAGISAERVREIIRADDASIMTWDDVFAERDALRAEVADLKARLLEAERGAEELVRLRAERREMHDLLAETCKAYDEAIHWEDLRQALKRVKSALEVAHD